MLGQRLLAQVYHNKMVDAVVVQDNFLSHGGSFTRHDCVVDAISNLEQTFQWPHPGRLLSNLTSRLSADMNMSYCTRVNPSRHMVATTSVSPGVKIDLDFELALEGVFLTVTPTYTVLESPSIHDIEDLVKAGQDAEKKAKVYLRAIRDLLELQLVFWIKMFYRETEAKLNE